MGFPRISIRILLVLPMVVKEGFAPANKNIFSSCSFRGEEGLNQRDEQRQFNGFKG
jgi:hypothetical protein